jgi:hypothetical protein
MSQGVAQTLKPKAADTLVPSAASSEARAVELTESYPSWRNRDFWDDPARRPAQVTVVVREYPDMVRRPHLASRRGRKGRVGEGVGRGGEGGRDTG